MERAQQADKQEKCSNRQIRLAYKEALLLLKKANISINSY